MSCPGTSPTGVSIRSGIGMAAADVRSRLGHRATLEAPANAAAALGRRIDVSVAFPRKGDVSTLTVNRGTTEAAGR
jgi:hypothetical protein